MKQKTLFKIIILALCIIVLFFVFDKDNNASDNINNISKNDLAFKYDKNDVRLESLFDVIDNEETDLSGRVLVFNPNPNIPSSLYGLSLDDCITLLNDVGYEIYWFTIDCCCGLNEKGGISLSMFNSENDIYLLNCIPNSYDDFYYEYFQYYVLPSNSCNFEIRGYEEELRLFLDEILLISKESVLKDGEKC